MIYNNNQVFHTECKEGGSVALVDILSIHVAFLLFESIFCFMAALLCALKNSRVPVLLIHGEADRKSIQPGGIPSL